MKIDHKKRARKAWKILTKCAKEGDEPFTYGSLCEKMGLHHRAAGHFLGVIQTFCAENKLPPLQGLVVNKKTRIPGCGYLGSKRTLESHKLAIKKVYAKDWSKIDPDF